VSCLARGEEYDVRLIEISADKDGKGKRVSAVPSLAPIPIAPS
jgi:hypothetical protein